jgi:hypothetical protein
VSSRNRHLPCSNLIGQNVTTMVQKNNYSISDNFYDTWGGVIQRCRRRWRGYGGCGHSCWRSSRCGSCCLALLLVEGLGGVFSGNWLQGRPQWGLGRMWLIYGWLGSWFERWGGIPVLNHLEMYTKFVCLINLIQCVCNSLFTGIFGTRHLN